MMRSILKMKLKMQPPDVFVQPPVSTFRVMDFLKAGQIIESTTPIYDEFKRKLDRAVEKKIKQKP